MNREHAPALAERLQHVEALIADIERSVEPAARDKTRRFVQAVLDLHAGGLARILEILAEHGEAGQAILETLVHDGLVSSLLLLHDVHPMDLAARVQVALVDVGSRLAGHGLAVELVATVDGVVRVRVNRTTRGAVPRSALVLIEQALTQAAPDATAVEIDGV